MLFWAYLLLGAAILAHHLGYPDVMVASQIVSSIVFFAVNMAADKIIKRLEKPNRKAPDGRKRIDLSGS